jgi:HD-GYP domain-containing protein (c-di-GMP phosphodiesterase class II)
VAEPSVKQPHRPGADERRRRAEALERHRGDIRARRLKPGGEIAHLREQLHLGARLTARLAAKSDVQEMAQLVVDELHETFDFYLAAVQRLDGDGVLRLLAARGLLGEVMKEFLLTEQSVSEGVNGRVARSSVTALVTDTWADRDYMVRDPRTDPRSELTAAIVVDGSVWGVLNIEETDPGALGETDAVLVEAVAASFGSAVHRANLMADLENTFTTTLAVLASTVEAKDDYTACHGEDVAELVERVALRMSLPARQAREARYAALLHDIGKVAVPSEILLKPGPLTKEEWAVMRTHAAIGGQLVARIEAFAHLAPAVRASHERWDGTGYPDGLAAESIPLAARIIAACDTYDAIVTDRPYRRARSPREARAELLRVARTQLDPRVVDAVVEELDGN